MGLSLDAAGATPTLHFVRFSSTFPRELRGDRAYVSWSFPPEKKQPGRRPKKRAQKHVPKGVRVVLFACCSAPGGMPARVVGACSLVACWSGCSCFGFLVVLYVSQDTSRGCFSKLVSWGKPTENSHQISNLVRLSPSSYVVLAESVVDVSSCA